MRTATRMVVLGRKFDTDAQAYITAVETADGAALEGGVKTAINNFVVGCKADGIWSAIKASCILAGARTLNGALVPLAGTAPTNFNFVSGDYNRKTGLIGNGVDKYLDAERSSNADPQNSRHLSVYATEIETGRINPAFIGGSQETFNGRSFMCANNTTFPRSFQSSLANRTATTTSLALNFSAGFVGISRSQSALYLARLNSTNSTISIASENLSTSATLVFARVSGTPDNHSAHRLAFYSIGESLNLALLDARVTTLINTYSTAIV
jgi:hypothetical protein